MKLDKNILVMTGAIMLGLGPVLMQKSTTEWGWWLGQVMVVVGPILMGSRAVSSMNEQNKSK